MQFSPAVIDTLFRRYKVHILVFILALFAALTIAHPSIFLTDELITINQVAQIQEGHQVIFNEGKYGLSGAGIISDHLYAKNNYLAYPLFLPLVSLPTLWFVNGMDRFFIYIVIYIWTFLLIFLALFMNAYFPSFVYFGKYRWTSGLIAAAFILFFASLFVNQPFSITGNDAFPEVMAVVLTNILLFTLIAVMIYEINSSVFTESQYAVFGTMVCLSCSSYLYWANFCKDHILVAFLVVFITLMVVKFLKNNNITYLAGAFFLSGLLAWVRPEVALFVFASLCLFVIYIFFIRKNRSASVLQLYPLFITPLFTLMGAVPFFINNYLFTKNIFIPAWILWKIPEVSAGMAAARNVPVETLTTDTLGSLLHLFLSTINFQPATVLSDTYGVFFNPQNGNLGVFPIIPLFLIAIFLVPVLWLFGKWQISSDEKHLLVAMSLIALGVFFTYFRGISGMNSSVGIAPDMRYLSPIYLPLNIIGLVVIRKIPGISDMPSAIVRWMICIWGCLIPLSVLLTVMVYPEPGIFAELFIPLNALTTFFVLIFVGICLVYAIGILQFSFSKYYFGVLLAIACSLPLIWQINASFIVRMYGIGMGGYSFIVPVVRGILLFHFI